MSAAIRTIIADDEPLARRMLRKLLAKDAQIAVIGEASDGQETHQLVRKLAPELLLLDIQMPDVDGLTALRDIPDKPVVILITAHAEHAVSAFDLEATDYVLKPFDDARLERALARAKSQVRTRNLVKLAHSIASGESPKAEPKRGGDRLALHEGQRIVMVEVEDIDWIEAADYYTKVHARNGRHLIRMPMQELEERLGSRFVRIHRGALVNLNRIERLESLDGETFAVLRAGTRLRVSRSRRQHVAQVLGAI